MGTKTSRLESMGREFTKQFKLLSMQDQKQMARRDDQIAVNINFWRLIKSVETSELTKLNPWERENLKILAPFLLHIDPTEDGQSLPNKLSRLKGSKKPSIRRIEAMIMAGELPYFLEEMRNILTMMGTISLDPGRLLQDINSFSYGYKNSQVDEMRFTWGYDFFAA